MSVKVEWNPKDWEVKSKAVEKQLEPLVIHVTTLMNSEKSTKKRSGKSKKSSVLVSVLEKATANFIQKGQQIADENPQVAKEMSGVIEEIRSSGKAMIAASRDFVANPCNTIQRSEMVKSARTLLTSVTRLLILADMIDVQLLVKSTQTVEADLEKLRVVNSHSELEKTFKNFKLNANNLIRQAAKRQHDLRDPQIQDDLAAARAILKKSSTMLLSATKVHISHSQIVEARQNREEVLRQICEAVTTIGKVAKGDFESESENKVGKLATNLEKFEQIDVKCDKITLEEQLDEIIKGAQLISGAESIKNERKEKILAGCEDVREALQGLFTKMDPKVASKIGYKAKNLKRQLCKAVADQITAVFDPTNDSLLSLCHAAQSGDLKQVEICTSVFTQHCSKLVEVANQVCELSTSEDGVKMVRHAALLLEHLCPQVVNSARILAQQPQSLDARENMDMFKNEWQNQVKILLEAVDDITTVDDVLSVLENYILDDMNQCLAAMQGRNPDEIRETVQNIQNRSKRICEMVTSEMDNYEPCPYTRKVLQAVKMLNDRIKDFETKTETMIKVMSNNPEQELDENDFIDTTRLIYDGVREVRRAVLMNRADEDLDPEEVEIEENYSTDVMTRTQTVEENSEDMGGITVVRQAMSKLPEEDKRKIMQQVENFHSEKLTFDQEVTKWDDAGNDIVVLAKYMGMIMIQMTDFVRQKGPLKTTTDVINAAKKISETGNKLDKLTRQIAEQCPESSTKKDLLAYLERVALYSHQINIIAKVKADVQSANNEELILAGVESATSLIENAKNLMNAVVLTVKASYVATTKYTRTGANIQSPIVVWKMKIPEKKPLVRLEKPKEVRAVVRKGSQRVPQHPIKALAEFEL